MMRVRFPLPAPRCADIAQLVEHTLGKGEVGSSNLPISTTSLVSLSPDFIPVSDIQRATVWLMWWNHRFRVLEGQSNV